MTRSVPEYRIRLFLSVDLVGSTAFKADNGQILIESASPNPVWVQEMARFYRGFPDHLERAFGEVEKPSDWDSSVRGPRVWKTVGDEIIFCCRLICHDHLAICIKAFTIALDKYGQYLDNLDGPKLDLKGYAWIASFPYPNVTVRVFDQNNNAVADGDIPSEEIESKGDSNPASFDFLGKDIDAGFRIGKNCSADSLALSVDLAHLLSGYGDKRPLDGTRYSYSGRQALKGVMNGRPYPIISIDVERSESRRKLRHFERAIGGLDQLLNPIDVNSFTSAFLIDAKVSAYCLKNTCSDSSDSQLPPEYILFEEKWQAIQKEIENRERLEIQAAENTESNDTQQPIDADISTNAVEAVKRVQSFNNVLEITENLARFRDNISMMSRLRADFVNSEANMKALRSLQNLSTTLGGGPKKTISNTDSNDKNKDEKN